MNQQQKIVLAAALGYIAGAVITAKAYKHAVNEYEKRQAKMQMVVSHMLDDFSPYVPEEVMTETRMKMEFDAIVIEEEGIKK